MNTRYIWDGTITFDGSIYTTDPQDRNRLQSLHDNYIGQYSLSFWADFYSLLVKEGGIREETKEILLKYNIETFKNFREAIYDNSPYFFSTHFNSYFTKDRMCQSCKDLNTPPSCQCVICPKCNEKKMPYFMNAEPFYMCRECLWAHTRICGFCDERFDISQIVDGMCGECENSGARDLNPDDEIRSYHSRGDKKENVNEPFKFGVEVEKEDDGVKFKGILKDWVVESDGSLDDELGFELVSPTYTSVETFKNDINKNKRLQELINADYSDCCGGHIRVSSNTITAERLITKRATLFVYLLFLIYTERKDNYYCKFKEMNDVKKNDKYQFINIESTNMIEWRLFPAVKNVRNLFARVEVLEEIYRRAFKTNITYTFLKRSEKIKKLIETEEKNYEKIFAKLLKIRVKENEILEECS